MNTHFDLIERENFSLEAEFGLMLGILFNKDESGYCLTICFGPFIFQYFS